VVSCGSVRSNPLLLAIVAPSNSSFWFSMISSPALLFVLNVYKQVLPMTMSGACQPQSWVREWTRDFLCTCVSCYCRKCFWFDVFPTVVLVTSRIFQRIASCKYAENQACGSTLGKCACPRHEGRGPLFIGLPNSQIRAVSHVEGQQATVCLCKS
jgi:hypothetical protein